jgi:hypothetical protein
VAIVAGGGFLTGFYGLWGLNYARSPLDRRLGWPEGITTSSMDDMEELATRLLIATNADYERVHGSTDAGVPSRMPPSDEVDAALAAAWPKVATLLGLPERFGRPLSRPKPRTFAIVYEQMWLIGMYAPFTAESQYNPATPAIQLGQGIAHEEAHARGIAPEDEANFTGFLCARLSGHPFLVYSADLFAHRQLAQEIQRRDYDRAKALILRRDPGVQRDVVDAVHHWDRTYGVVATATATMNDLYLKTNQVEGGIEAYSRSAALILGWWHQHPEFYGGTEPAR